MLTYQRNVLKSRVNTVLGTLFLSVWTFGVCLILWQASSDQNPVAHVFTKMLYEEANL